ncbi:MAG: hypothetical protein PHN88_09550 [Ignavibacteria bacterium]|nr:hypothetical protein [Ignavibacteria bacterium]
MTQTINNPDSKFGYNMGVGAEIPLNEFLTLEVNPLFNILYSLDEGPVFRNYETNMKITFGLSYKL